jgi:soluble lytic murein transglycosylase-like protein
MRSLSNSARILIATLALWAIAFSAVPAHSQIVSYMDGSGKRVFVNSDPAPPKVVSKVPLLRTGADGVTQRSPRISTPEMSAIERANREKIEDMIREVSARYRVDPALVRAVIETESHWNSGAVSRKGAQGLMQLVPGTAQELGVNNALDPKQNLDAGVRYLRTQLERYNGDLDRALAAYNAGPHAVDRAGGVPQYRETRNYVQKVTDSYFRPGSDRLPRAFDAPHPIYREVDTDGRVVFKNE